MRSLLLISVLAAAACGGGAAVDAGMDGGAARDGASDLSAYDMPDWGDTGPCDEWTLPPHCHDVSPPGWCGPPMFVCDDASVDGGDVDGGSVDLGGDTSCPACPGLPPGCRIVTPPGPCSCGTYVCDDAGPRPDLGPDASCVPTGPCLTDHDCACGFCYAGICT